MKEFNILSTIDMEQEWITLCSLMYDEDYVTKTEEKYSSTIESKQLFDTAINTLKYMLTKFDTFTNNYKTLFEPITYSSNIDDTDILATVNIARFVLYFKQRNGDHATLLLERLNSVFSKEFASLVDFKNWIFSEPSVTDRTKYLVLLLIDNYDYLAQIYNSFITPLLKHNDGILKKVIPLQENWQNTISGSWLEQLFDEYNLELKDENSIISVQMSFVLINSATISYRENILLANCGCFIVELVSIKKQMKDYDDQLIFAAKQLSDKTKLEILKYCNEKQRYGTEIAEHLGISGATVSHHMNTLTDSRFVNVKLVKNRVYYSTNLQKIKEVLSLIDLILN